MLDFKCTTDEKGQAYIETSLQGKLLLTIPQLNKGTAFTLEERKAFNLIGKLPIQVESLEEQTKRAYRQYGAFVTQLKKNIYLNNLHDTNHVLFYKLVSEYLSEMLPTIYTPIVGTAVKHYSQEFRKPRGLYITYSDRDNIDEILSNRSNPEVGLIVATDGEGVLGIGDQGIGGMDIPIAKLMVYTLCGGIDPNRTLPILLDVGTNNQELLDDPLYLGARHERIAGKNYDDFIHQFVSAVEKRFPHIFLHWEDFGRHNARRILNRFQDKLCTFNDDIQGTGTVTLSALLAATSASHSTLEDQRIVVFGGGSAGTGISDQIYDAMVKSGLSEQEAKKRFWIIDKQGLLIAGDPHLTPAQALYARDPQELTQWACADKTNISLLDTITHVKPTTLVGCSAVPGAFTQEVIETMAQHVKQPIIFPLSNPTDRCEAIPEDILNWTHGEALIATGTAFTDVEYNGRMIPIAQCNNALVFPGIGLGVQAVGATRLTSHMIWQACQALSQCAPAIKDPHAQLLPPLSQAQDVAKKIAVAVGQQAIKEGLAVKNQDKDLNKIIEEMFWHPHYLPYLKRSPSE
ncbi:MAG: NAD-dependent malic enzyme [Gammaproteobacteria bacterium]